MFSCSRNFIALSMIVATSFVFSLFVSPVMAQKEGSTRHQEGLHENKPNSFVLKGATVIPRPGMKIEDGTIVIRDGRIVSVRGDGDWPADHRVIDMTGKTIYAGFIDGFSEQEITISEAPEHAKYWNSNIRPERDMVKLFQWDEKDIKSYVENGISTVLVAPGAGIIRGQAALVLADASNPEQMVVVPRVAQTAQLTVARRSGGPRIYPSSPMGAVALARQAMYDAQWYSEAWKVADTSLDINKPEMNSSLQALQSVVNKKQPLLVVASNELMALRAKRFADEFNVELMIVGSGNEYRRLKEITDLSRPLIIPVNFAAPPAVATAEDAMNVTLESLMHWDLAPENPARLAEAGVRFAFTTQGLKKKSEFLKRIRQAVARGLSPDDALAAMTTNPAEFFNAASQVGTIETGRIANLVVTDGDLFDDETKIVETWVAGHRHQTEAEPQRDVQGRWQIELPDEKILILKVKKDDDKLSGSIIDPDKVASEDGADEEEADEEEADEEEAADEKEGEEADDPQEEKEGDEESKEDDEKESKKDGSTKVKSLALIGSRLSGSFRTKDKDRPGTVQFSIIIEPENNSGVGHIIWPDGQRQSLTAKTVADEKPQEEDEKSNDDSKDKKSKKDKKDAKFSKLPASFPVNYPLGAFGVTELPGTESVLFDNVTVWTCGDQGILENAAVLIVNGKIEGVYSSDQDRPTVDRVVDCEGKHLTPGIIDCHSHFATDSGVNEGAQAITSEVRIGDFIDCDDVTIYRQLAGGVTASNILHGSANPIGGQNQVVKLRWGVNDEQLKMSEAPQGIKFALGENVKRSRSAGNRNVTPRYPTTRMGVEQLMHDTFRAAKEYERRKADWNSNRDGLPPKVDLELDAIVEILNGERWIHCHSYRQDEILALIRVLDEYEITIGTFQHILEGYKVAEKMAEHGAMASAFADWWAYKFEVYDAIPYGGKLMHDAGIVVSFNSDDGELATHLNQEAAKAVKYGGVPPEEALKFVTLNPAKQLRIENHVGSIEVGKHADIVLWSGSPLSGYSRCEQTWVDGRKYFDITEDAASRKLVATMRQTLIQKILDSGEPMRSDDSRNDDPQNMWPRYDAFCGAHVHTEADGQLLQQVQQAWLEEEEE